MVRVGIDLDGCVYDYVGAMREFLQDDNPKMVCPEPDRWEMWECWGLTKDHWDTLVADSIKDGVFYNGAAYPGAKDALHELRHLGNTLHIVTTRMTPDAQTQTVAWLRSHHIPYDTLTFTADKLDVPCDTFIEDSSTNALRLADAGRSVFLMHRPWNENTEAHGRIPLVFTWQDFVAEVQHLHGRVHANEEAAALRRFATGATRDTDVGKLDYEGFLSPAVLRRFAEYMHENRKLSDGSLRDSDNWQDGIPTDVYMKSMWRHFWDVWANHRGAETGVPQEEALCAVMFNVMGLLYETLRDEEMK